MAPDGAALAELICASYRRFAGSDLIEPGPDLALRLERAELVVVAHDGGVDPRFTYANRRARELWGYPAEVFIGLPSRLSAPPEEREDRRRLLDQGQDRDLVVARDLVRVDATGRRFRISEVQLWNLCDGHDRSYTPQGRHGQAACYGSWSWIDGPAGPGDRRTDFAGRPSRS